MKGRQYIGTSMRTFKRKTSFLHLLVIKSFLCASSPLVALHTLLGTTCRHYRLPFPQAQLAHHDPPWDPAEVEYDVATAPPTNMLFFIHFAHLVNEATVIGFAWQPVLSTSLQRDASFKLHCLMAACFSSRNSLTSCRKWMGRGRGIRREESNSGRLEGVSERRARRREKGK